MNRLPYDLQNVCTRQPIKTAQAPRHDTYLLQIHLTACQTCLCKGHKFGSYNGKTEMQVKEMVKIMGEVSLNVEKTAKTFG